MKRHNTMAASRDEVRREPGRIVDTELLRRNDGNTGKTANMEFSIGRAGEGKIALPQRFELLAGKQRGRQRRGLSRSS
nr:hypothetical protein [Nitrogeniibacter aestuarii]